MTRILDPVKNFAKVVVSTRYDASATTIVLRTGQGSKLPQPSTDGSFNLVWYNSTRYPDPTDDPNVEIVRCTARSTDTLTVTRASESTSASSKNTVGCTYKMLLGITQKMIDDIEDKIKRSGSVVVGFDDSCDYKCDGTADDVQIQSAIDEADSAGRRVYLKGGTDYDITTTIDKKGCSIYGESMAGVVLKWSGASSVAMLENTADNPFEISDITFDGVTNTNGVIGLQPNGVNCERPVLTRVKFFNMGVGLKTNNSGYKFWDGTCYSCYWRYCAIGLQAGEYQFTLFDPLFSYNTIGSQLDINSNLHVTQGTYTLNGIDLYFAGSPENCSFRGVWFEESSTAVASCAGTDIYSKVLGFTDCRFHTQSATKLMGLESIIGMVNFVSCLFLTKDLGGGSESSTDIVGGTYTDISYLGCMKMNLAGALTPYGDLNIPTRIKVDTIIEHTTDNGIQLEGVTLKDSIAYVPDLLVVDDITAYTSGSVNCNVPIKVDTLSEYTTDNGIQIEGVTSKDNNLYTPGFVATNEITQYNAGYVAISSWFRTNTISEYVTDTGVTVEGVLLKDSTITLINAINEFSTDTGLTGNSDTAVPTEKAVKTYVDGLISGENLWDRTSTTISPHTANDNLDIGTGYVTTRAVVTDTILEKTLDNGVQIEGITCKDSILYVPDILAVDDITQYSSGSVSINSPLRVNVINEYGTDTGVTIEGITLKDSIAYVPSFLVTNEITQYTGTSVYVNSDLVITSHKMYFSANSYAEYNTGTTSIDFYIS